ncbi:hypothetical protein V8C42DRAFT_339956 [Trichoderma barbatum]
MELFANLGEGGPPQALVDPNLSVSAQATYLRQQRHRLLWAKQMGALEVGENFSLTLDDSGFLSVPGVPIFSAEELAAPGPVILHGQRGEDRLDNLLQQALLPTFEDAEEAEGPSPLVGDVLRPISSSQPWKHHAWATLHRRLSLEQSDIPEKTPEGLLTAREEGIAAEKRTWQKLEWLDEGLRLGILASAGPETIIRAICELAGLDLSGDDSDPLASLAGLSADLGSWVEDMERHFGEGSDRGSTEDRDDSPGEISPMDTDPGSGSDSDEDQPPSGPEGNSGSEDSSTEDDDQRPDAAPAGPSSQMREPTPDEGTSHQMETWEDDGEEFQGLGDLNDDVAEGITPEVLETAPENRILEEGAAGTEIMGDDEGLIGIVGGETLIIPNATEQHDGTQTPPLDIIDLTPGSPFASRKRSANSPVRGHAPTKKQKPTSKLRGSNLHAQQFNPEDTLTL